MEKKLDMCGPYEFTIEKIDKIISDNKIGNYALGYVETDCFYVLYVGRSDTDLKDRIKQHIDEKENYKHFKYSYADSSKEAYEKECKNWHDFGGKTGKLDNKIHPDNPNDKNYKCPICEK